MWVYVQAAQDAVESGSQSSKVSEDLQHILQIKQSTKCFATDGNICVRTEKQIAHKTRKTQGGVQKVVEVFV